MSWKPGTVMGSRFVEAVAPSWGYAAGGGDAKNGRVILLVVMASVSRQQWSWWPEVGSTCVWTGVVPQHSNPFTFFYILFLRKFSLCTIGRICDAFGRLMLPPEWAFPALKKKRLFLPYFNILLFLFIAWIFAALKHFLIYVSTYLLCVYCVSEYDLYMQ